MNKLVAFSGILSLFILLTCSSSVYALTINFQQCANNIDHHCMIYLPQQNTGNSTNPNMHFTAIFPQNGAPHVDAIFSDGNWTHWKNNVAVVWVGNIYTTSIPPTMNFCPLALASLINQDGYLYKFYNVTATPILNLTHYIYPSYCIPETGPNPIDGTTTVPEFGSVAAVVLALGTMLVIVWSKKK